MSKIYTKTGDEGTTSSLCGIRYRKDDSIIECLGCADELITQMERVKAGLINDEVFVKDINKIIDALFQIMAELSNGKASGLSKTVQQGYIDRLEKRMDEIGLKVGGFKYFNTIIALDISEARVRTRKLERSMTHLLRDDIIRCIIYKYVNRLSDYLFILAVEVDNDKK